MTDRRNEKKAKTNKNPWRLTALAIGAFLVLIIIMGITMLTQQPAINEKTEELEEQKKTIEELSERIEELENELNYMGTDEYIERTARDRLGMVKENEIIFKEKES